MTKLAIEERKSHRRAIRRGTRGEMYPVLDKNLEVVGRKWKRACYCLSRNLPGISETTRCPAHGAPIGTHPARTQLFKLRK